MTKQQTHSLLLLVGIALSFYIIGTLDETIRALVLLSLVLIIFGRLYK